MSSLPDNLSAAIDEPGFQQPIIQRYDVEQLKLRQFEVKRLTLQDGDTVSMFYDPVPEWYHISGYANGQTTVYLHVGLGPTLQMSQAHTLQLAVLQQSGYIRLPARSQHLTVQAIGGACTIIVTAYAQLEFDYQA